jgi:cytidine deaminase
MNCNDINVKLIRQAFKARENSYSPYSKYMVGAALMTKSGKIYTGCNIENAAYTPTNCAERTAFFKAVSEGEREFEAIAIVGGYKGAPTDFAYPCGVCRQVMMEFCNPSDFRVITAVSKENYVETTLDRLLPNGFEPATLEVNTDNGKA